jgi:putative transposase
MSHAFSNLLTHIVFSTKERRALIEDEFENELHAYLGGLIKESGGKAYIVGGTENHIHLLVSLPPKVCLSDVIRFVKSNSTNFVKAKFNRRLFAWQTGYGAFSVSKSNVPQVVKYIQNQKEHHRKISFQEEFVQFLRANAIEYDERWLWK